MENRLCLVCSELLQGRRDKKFCSDYCRATHFNKKHQNVHAQIRYINSIIRKNRNILNSLYAKGQQYVSHKILAEEGFRFDYHTFSCQIEEGRTGYLCYDLGYAKTNNDRYLLFEWKELRDITTLTEAKKDRGFVTVLDQLEFRRPPQVVQEKQIVQSLELQAEDLAHPVL